jgi:hypothetical protein
VNAALLHELESLLAAPAVTDELSLARLEDTLTAGYAQALALESERMRLERRLGELAVELAAGAEDVRTRGELASLARSLSDTEENLEQLRGLLASVRVRASDLRALVMAS